MMVTKRVAGLVFSAAALAAFAAPLACGGGNSNANANAGFSFGTDAGAAPPPAGTCAPGQPCPPPPAGTCAPGQVCPAPTASASAAPSGCAPGQPCNPLDPAFLANILAAGTALMGTMGADPADLGVKAAAAKYAPGMSPDGQEAKGQVQQGGHVQFILNMDPSKCYTIVGYGLGVNDLDVNLLAPPFYNLTAGHDETNGPTAVIGGAPHPMCPALPMTIAYKVDLYARGGAGQVAAQVYSKPR